MGMGDEIMATGDARRAQAADPRPVVIVDRHGRPRQHPLWHGNTRIVATRGPDTQAIVNGPKCRPYIDYGRSTKARWQWNSYRATPGELFWVQPDNRGAGLIVIEPNVKDNASPNKLWGRWQALVDASPQLPWVQLGPSGSKWLNGVRHIVTNSFEEAVNVMAAARTAVLPEGGLHHAAAAVGLPAVVLFGGYISPATTGYDMHRNIWVDDINARGWRVSHPACAAAWHRITVEHVLDTLANVSR
jgi:hypothetical protein